MTDFCIVKITVEEPKEKATAPSEKAPTATPSAGVTGNRENTLYLLLLSLLAILLGGYWRNRLDPAWAKFEKDLTGSRKEK